MSFNPKNVTLSELVGEYLKTNFNADGVINNLLAYALKNQPLDGSLNIKADQMNLNDWMGSMPADTASATATAKQDRGHNRLRAIRRAGEDRFYDQGQRGQAAL